MIDRLNELNRILDVAFTLEGKNLRRDIPLVAILRMCRSNVRYGLLPDHEKSVSFAVELGFLQLVNGDFSLTPEGRFFLSLNPERYYELTSDQARHLANMHYLDGKYAVQCRSILSYFSITDNPPRLVWSELDDSAFQTAPWLLSHLCQIGLLVRTEEGYESSSDMTNLLINFIDEPKGMTEERLRELLHEREVLGEIGEELAVAFERDRLASAGHVVEAHCVKRISKFRVNAGYDIESFDGHSTTNGCDRYIEVKTSRGKNLRFYWTENEMRIAQKLGERYWIYFFGGVNQATKSTKVHPLLFQNPMVTLMHNNEISKQTNGLFVYAEMSGALA
jgi:hypothetical protein